MYQCDDSSHNLFDLYINFNFAIAKLEFLSQNDQRKQFKLKFLA